MNYEGVYQKLQKQIASIGYDAKATSIEIVRFPIPRVDLGDVSIPHLLSAKKLEIKFSILSILMLNPTIKIIEIRDVDIITPKNGLDLSGHEASIATILRAIPKLPKMTLHNVSLIDKNTKNIDSHIDSVLVDPKASHNQLVIDWNKEDHTNLSYQNIDNGTKLLIESESNSYILKLEEFYKDEKLQTGTLTYNINNLQKFIATRYQDLDLLITKIQSPESGKFTCKMKLDGDRIRISDITFNKD